jgi:hypothetical protein
MKKRGQILAENVIFIILNLLFLTILLLFIHSKTGGEFLLEEKYAKQIALMIDSSKPKTTIYLNMEDAIEKAKGNGIDPREIVKIQGSVVTVKLREKGQYSYSFFNNVKVSSNLDTSNPKEPKEYVFIISEYR